MTDVATKVADGIIIHPLNSSRTLNQHSILQIESGLLAADRCRESCTVVAGAIIGVWDDDTTRAKVEHALDQSVLIEAARRRMHQIAAEPASS